MDGQALPFRNEFDAVFSNAVLHWIKRADPMIASVYRSLRYGGRFVAVCGGHGCVDKVRTGLVQALHRRGINGEARVPWYFPTPGDYATRLEQAGFHVDSIALLPRPTPCLATSSTGSRHLPKAFFKGFRATRGQNICTRSAPYSSHSCATAREYGLQTTCDFDSARPKARPLPRSESDQPSRVARATRWHETARHPVTRHIW